MITDRDPAIAELRGNVRRFVDGPLADWPAKLAATGEFTPDMLATFARQGLLGVRIDEAYGGAAMSLREYCLVQEEVSRASPMLSLLGSATSGLAPMAIQRHGTAAQKTRFLPPLTRGESRTCFALTEPEAGSDASSIKTRATRASGGWVLNGTKHFLTFADVADVLMVMAVTDPAKRSRGGITAFLVPHTSPGFKVTRVDHTIGSRAWSLGEIHLADCFVPDENIVGEVGQGFAIAMESLNEGRLNVASICLGAAGRLLERAVAHAQDRRTFGAPLADRQAIQWMLADSATDVTAARALIDNALDAIEHDRPVGAAASMAKLFASEMAFRVADRAVQIHGATGVVDSSPVGMMFRDLRLFRVGEGASEIQRMVIARSLFGASR